MILRACERLSPLSVYGRPWCDLEREEQMELIGYELTRAHEECPPSNDG